MSVISMVLIISSIVMIGITGEEQFCAEDRKLLLGGVFNYDKIIFAYSWKEVNAVQLWLVWRYEVKKNKLIPIGQDVTVDQIFPSIPLFRAGFGLTMKCDASDTTCKSYRQLVFIFFQTSYKTFRFANDVFAAEPDPTKMPWGLKPRGEASDWFFGSHGMDNINSIVFMSGYQSQIFIVSKDVLYVSAVDIKAPTLKWSQLTQSKDLVNSLGGIVIGSDIYINKNEAPDSTLIKFDQNGKESEKIKVRKFFGCDKSDQSIGPEDHFSGGEGANAESEAPSELSSIDMEKNDNLATVILVCIIVVIVLTNIIVGLFWLSVYRRHSNNSEP